jgi:putative peptidoglycan lipid II flippase
VRRFSIAEAAVILMLALLTSRVLGVVRQVLFNSMFDPASPEVNAYIAAARLPEVLYNLVAGGALIHAFVPIFLSYEKEKGEMDAWRLTSLVLNVLFVIMSLLILVSEFLTPTLVDRVLTPGFSSERKAITVDLTRIMLLQPLILSIGSVLSSILNSKRQFLLPALALAVYNFGLIGGLLVARLVPGVGIYGPTYGVVVAACLQVLVQVPALLKQRMRYFFTWDLRNPGLHQVLLLLLPNALAIGVYSLGTIIDTLFSSYMKDPNSLSALHNAEMLQGLPIALIAQAVGQSLLPHLSSHAAKGQYFRMRQTAVKVMGVSLLFTIPALVILIAVGQPLITILFQHGEFTEHASHLTYLALIGYALAIPGSAAGNLISAGFFALKDAFTPFLLNVYALLVRLALLALFFWTLPEGLLILTVPLAYLISGTTEALFLYLLLYYRLRKRLKGDEAVKRLQRRRTYLQARQQLVPTLFGKSQQ